MAQEPAYFEFLCRMGDNALVLGHRLSEWCGHAPALEEDIALANTGLDLIGEAQLWLGLASDVEDRGRTADDLAMGRDVWDFRNHLLTEQPNGDFGQTMMRQYLFDAWHVCLLDALCDSSQAHTAEIAAKTVKEARYHLTRSRSIVIGLGDGTSESHRRMQTALDRLFPYVGEFFETDSIDRAMTASRIAPDPNSLKDPYLETIRSTFLDATLSVPEQEFYLSGGKTGRQHSEHLGHLLTQMQWLQRAYPEASW